MFREDAETFRTVIEDLCVAFNRPCTDHVVRVFWETLKHMPMGEVRRSMESARKNLRRFPTPKDLTPERKYTPASAIDTGPEMSRWAVAANKILFAVAYSDLRRGTKPIAVYPPMPERGWGLPLKTPVALDDSLLQRVLVVKADYVAMGEQSEREGEPMTGPDFSAMCMEGFRKTLGTLNAASA